MLYTDALLLMFFFFLLCLFDEGKLDLLDLRGHYDRSFREASSESIISLFCLHNALGIIAVNRACRVGFCKMLENNC